MTNARRAIVIAACAALLPMFLIFGDGIGTGPGGYGNAAGHAPVYDFVKKLPADATLAGQFRIVDKTPLFAGRKTYVMRSLAHPFRPGYYAETERRIRETYGALYAHDMKDVIAFCEREGIDYLAFDARAFVAVDDQLFEPVKREMARRFVENKARGFALARPPAGAVAFRGAGVTILDAKKLSAGDPAAEPVAPDESPPQKAEDPQDEP